MDSWERYANYNIGAAVLDALLLVATGGAFLASLCLCRRMSDKARSVVIWMKVAFFFLGIYAFLDLLYRIFIVLNARGILYGFGTMNTLGPLAYTLQIIYKTLVFTTLSSLARGLLFARSGQRAKLALPAAVLTYGLTALNTILAIAYLGVALYYNFGDESSFRFAFHINRLVSVPMIFLFVASLASLAVSGLIFTKVKTQYPTLKAASIGYIVASFTFFVSSLYEIIYIGLYVSFSPFDDTQDDYEFYAILMWFFSTLPAFLSLAVIFNLTRTKGTGLWTVVGGAAAPGAFKPGPVGAVPAPAPGAGPQAQFQPGFQGVPAGQPQSAQGQFGGYQQGYFPQGAAPQGWQPQGYYYPPQQPGQFVQGQPQMQQQVPQQYPQYPMQTSPSPVTQPSPPQPAPAQPAPTHPAA